MGSPPSAMVVLVALWLGRAASPSPVAGAASALTPRLGGAARGPWSRAVGPRGGTASPSRWLRGGGEPEKARRPGVVGGALHASPIPLLPLSFPVLVQFASKAHLGLRGGHECSRLVGIKAPRAWVQCVARVQLCISQGYGVGRAQSRPALGLLGARGRACLRADGRAQTCPPTPSTRSDAVDATSGASTAPATPAPPQTKINEEAP